MRKIGEKSGKIGEKEEKSRRKGQNREISFTLPLLNDRAGYAIDLGSIEAISVTSDYPQKIMAAEIVGKITALTVTE